jgi:hypothetical protein
MTSQDHGASDKLGSMYCGDPDCKSCQQLRETEEQISRNEDPEVSKSTDTISGRTIES